MNNTLQNIEAPNGLQLNCLRTGEHKSSDWIRDAQTDIAGLEIIQEYNLAVEKIEENNGVCTISFMPRCLSCLAQIACRHREHNSVLWVWTLESRIDTLLQMLKYAITVAENHKTMCVCNTGVQILVSSQGKKSQRRCHREVTKEELAYCPETAALVYGPGVHDVLQLRTRAIKK